MISKASTTRTLYLKVPPKDGNPSVGMVCSHSRISYSRNEPYETDVIVQVNEGGVLVTPSQITLQLAYAADPNTFQNVVLNQNYGYMKLTQKIVNKNSSFHFTFTKGASFRGQLKFTVRYKDVDYYAYVDVTNYTEQTSVECEMSSLSYNPADNTHSILFDAYITINEVKVTDYELSANWQTKDGEDVVITPATINATSFFQGLSICRHRDEMLRLTIQKGATFEGSLKIILTKGDISRSALITITRVENGTNGKDATYIECDISSLVYKESEDSMATFNAYLYVDGVKQEMEDVTSEVWALPNEGDPVKFESLFSPSCNGLLALQGDDFFFVHYAENATFEGAVFLKLSKGDVSRSVQLPVLRIPKVENGKNSVSLETSCDAVVYNNSKDYAKVISFLISDGGEPYDVILDSIKFNGESVVSVLTDYENDGMTLHYTQPQVILPTGTVRPAVLSMTFAKGATAQGTIEVAETYKGVTYKAEISVTCVENGEQGEQGPPGDDGISLVCSTNAITYNPVVPKIVTVSVVVMEGATAKRPDFVSAVFADNSGIGWEYNNQLAENCGMRLTQAFDGNRHRVTLGFAVDATADGVLSLTYRYKGVVLPLQISVTRIENGIRGFNGASPRGPRLWTEVKALHSEPEDTEKFFSGKDNEEWLDIVLVIAENDRGEPYERYFRPKVTHFVKDSPNPTDVEHGAADYWEQSSDTPFIATQLLFAKRAKVDNLVSEGIEMNEDVNGVRKVVFSASKYEENGQTKAVVYASKGKFENVEVIGDIKSNTQTFVTPEFPADDIHMWETDYGLRNPSDIIRLRPNGGCIIAPTGKCSYEILLPAVPLNTARQLIIVNQKMPYTQGSLEPINRPERKIYLTPDGTFVNVFPSMSSEESNSKPMTAVNPNNPQASETKSVQLGYGAFMVFGYSDYEPSIGGLFMTRTFWSVWQMSMGESAIIPEPEPFTPKSGSGVEIPMYHQTTLDDLIEPSPIG